MLETIGLTMIAVFAGIGIVASLGFVTAFLIMLGDYNHDN